MLSWSVCEKIASEKFFLLDHELVAYEGEPEPLEEAENYGSCALLLRKLFAVCQKFAC